MPGPVLVLASQPAADTIAGQLRTTLDTTVDIANQRRDALALLRRRAYDAILIDDVLADPDDELTDALHAQAGFASIVEVNFAIAGVSRVVRQVRSTLQRRARDLAGARAEAASEVRSELAAALSSLLLECELALRDAQPQQAPKLRHIVELAGDLRERLRPR